MKAVFTMWRNTRMIILTAVCAAIYSAALLAFKTAIPLIPGITEVRVGNIFPMPFGLMFGPAGAWGSAIGNLIGDIFGGTIGPSSLAGFVGNFLLGYLPYTLWTTLIPFHQKSMDWDSRSWSNWLTYFLIAFVTAAACAVVISIFVDFLGIVPYRVLVKIITVNNTIGGFIGIILLSSVFKLVKDHLRLHWTEVMEPADQGKPLTGPLGAWLVTGASLFGLFGGLWTDLPVSTLGWISTLFILIGGFLL
ncbi:MAG: QueT transporter family protein [Deltaproteobacteria bacterium]|nr:QueT transporter family protein [Deltaproteobacteria bacterium]